MFSYFSVKLFPDPQNKECSTCRAALASPRLAQVQAFMKLFLKLSERNAYSTGFTAELEYDKQPANKVTTMTKLSSLGIFSSSSSGLVDRKIKDNWLIQYGSQQKM